MTVLLVEDDVGIGRFVSQGLAARGVSVRWERSGREVEGLVATGGINLVILDLGLPDADGLDLCAAIRAMESGVDADRARLARRPARRLRRWR